MCVSMKQSQLENTGLCFHTMVNRHVGEDIVFPGRNVRSSQGLNLGFRCQGTLGGVLQRMQFGLGSNKMHPGM